jgi:SAM-dependent methyltransferase
MNSYDDTIKEHYASVAEQAGLSSASTMADQLIRKHETDAIAQFVELATTPGQRVGDFGCGNGYTLEVLAERFPDRRYVGVEYTPELLDLAKSRFAGAAGVTVGLGDIRIEGFHGDEQLDAVYCQRVLINLLDEADQKKALDNVVAAVKPGGCVLFIECFIEPLDDLNEARDEFEMEPIPPAHHNRYLEEGFFEHSELETFEMAGWEYPPNFLSTHYFVSRALEPGLTRWRDFKRNSKLQRFLSMAFPPAVGDFAPLQFHAFRRI